MCQTYDSVKFKVSEFSLSDEILPLLVYFIYWKNCMTLTIKHYCSPSHPHTYNYTNKHISPQTITYTNVCACVCMREREFVDVCVREREITSISKSFAKKIAEIIANT